MFINVMIDSVELHGSQDNLEILKVPDITKVEET